MEFPYCSYYMIFKQFFHFSQQSCKSSVNMEASLFRMYGTYHILLVYIFAESPTWRRWSASSWTSSICLPCVKLFNKKAWGVVEQSIWSSGVANKCKSGNQTAVCQLCAFLVNGAGLCLLHSKVFKPGNWSSVLMQMAASSSGSVAQAHFGVIVYCAVWPSRCRSSWWSIKIQKMHAM